MDIANQIPTNSGFQSTNDTETKNIYLQESYCGLNNDISASAEEIFSQISADKQNTLPASYIP
jgi:hypothetical protein